MAAAILSFITMIARQRAETDDVAAKVEFKFFNGQPCNPNPVDSDPPFPMSGVS